MRFSRSIPSFSFIGANLGTSISLLAIESTKDYDVKLFHAMPQNHYEEL